MHIKPFQAVYPRLKFISSNESFFGSVKQEYPEYKSNGFFQKSAKDGFYIYQIRTPQRTFTGLIATSSIEDYLDGSILKHEETLTNLEQTQLDLLLKRKAIVKPVLLTYPEVPAIEAWYEEYTQKQMPFFEIDFKEEHNYHKIWEVSGGEEILQLKQLFLDNIPRTFIADGHHRTSTAALLYQMYQKKNPPKYQHFLTAYFSFPQLEIYDYNRVVRDLGSISPARFVAELSKICDLKYLKKGRKPRQKHEITMTLNQEWYRLSWKKKALQKFKSESALLDANLLDELILKKILSINDIRNDRRLKYVEGPKGIEGVLDLTERAENRIGFFLHPVALHDFVHIAEMGNVMPPKSTWFEPRMKNGILVQDF